MNLQDPTIERLDRLIGLFELAFSAELTSARTLIRADDVVAAILDAADEWQAVGVVKTSVATAKNISEKTVQRRIAELVERRLLEVDGAAVARRIKSTKLA